MLHLPKMVRCRLINSVRFSMYAFSMVTKNDWPIWPELIP